MAGSKVRMEQLKNETFDIQRLSIGDVKAFNRLYERYHKVVHGNILKLVKAPETAKEILQDVFLALWQNRFKFERQDSVGGWLFVVSYNKSLKVLRKKLKESVTYVAEYVKEPMDDAYDVSEEEDRFMEQMNLLHEAVAVLPPRKKEVFRLCRYEGRSKEDVAEMLGISPQSVTDYLKQSNATIKEYVGQRYPSYAGSIMLFFFTIS